MCAVGFYASGSKQRVFGRNGDINIGQASVSKYVTEVTAALNEAQVMSVYTRFPKTYLERERVIARNDRCGLPRVFGFVDGSLVKVFPPNLEDCRAAYYCRKGYTALNIQVVCDADLNILSVDARFPGSCHDAFIFKKSGLRDSMMISYWESHCWLLATLNYPSILQFETLVMDMNHGCICPCLMLQGELQKVGTQMFTAGPEAQWRDALVY
ncbi:hypothetical protein FOCC_FOCC009615 [Frankliniella occidentalis]|nr:hypothetical protein FOCC_FOCC009615 [Frankliniella occidentalis]